KLEAVDGTPSGFDLDDRRAGHADGIGQVFLRQALALAEEGDLPADLGLGQVLGHAAERIVGQIEVKYSSIFNLFIVLFSSQSDQRSKPLRPAGTQSGAIRGICG